MLNILNAGKNMVYPNPATCDQQAFVDCLVGRDRSNTRSAMRQATNRFPDPYYMFQLFDTRCARDTQCEAVCISNPYGNGGYYDSSSATQ